MKKNSSKFRSKFITIKISYPTLLFLKEYFLNLELVLSTIITLSKFFKNSNYLLITTTGINQIQKFLRKDPKVSLTICQNQGLIRKKIYTESKRKEIKNVI